MRTMRFPVSIHEEESIPGALAKGIRDNVLERASIFFNDAGLAQRHAGLTQVMPGSETEKLAQFMQCDAEALASRVGVRTSERASSSLVQFGDLRLYGADVELKRRRVAPLTLRDQPFHRDAWLFSLLPYCPVSLERLVDRCTVCDLAIGWKRCWGIGECEWCRTLLPPSEHPHLPNELADDYRFFAALLCPRERIRRAAKLQLPAVLHDVAPGSLVTMVLRLGQICRADPILGAPRRSMARLDSQVLSSVIIAGTSMIRSWPDSFAGWARDEFEKQRDDLAGHHRVRAKIKRLGNAKLEDHAQARLIQKALPREFGSFVHSAAAGRFITATEFKLRTSVKQDSLDLIREELEDQRLPGLARVRSQLNVERVEEFAERYRTAIRLCRLTFELMLPPYAIEQLVCLGVIPQEHNKAVRIARHGMCVQRASADQLLDDLRQHALAGTAPAEAAALETAARQIGGREKPWGAIFDELRKGRIEFWVSGEKVTSRTIRVRPASLAHFQAITFRPADYQSFPFSTTVNNTEVEEILNVPAKYLPMLVEAKLLPGRIEKAVNKADVLRLAHLMVSPAELGFAMSQHPRPAGRAVSKLGVRRVGCGWSRADLVELGVFPVSCLQERRAA